MSFADAFDVNTPSELPKESSFHQDAAGGLRDLREEGRGVTTRTDTPDESGVLTWIIPLTPVLSIRLATFTVVPQMSY